MKRHWTSLFALYFLLTAFLIFSHANLFSYEYDALGLSHTIIDHYLFVTESELQSQAHEKGGWTPIDHPTLLDILAKNTNLATTAPGGSAANVIKGLAQLGHTCAVIGKVGADAPGEYYAKSMLKQGIVPILHQDALPTGQAICFITPDGERTFKTYLGASHSSSDLFIDLDLIKNVHLLHIEGYQLIDPDFILRTLQQAQEAGTIISIDLGNVEIVRRHKHFIYNILKEYVHIVFCNECEAEELTDLLPSEDCDTLSTFCDIAVVTMSEKGSWACSGNHKIYMEAFSVPVIDTTGAGDFFASGFLHGHLKGAPSTHVHGWEA